jgi:iron complex outermembrane receptor protein
MMGQAANFSVEPGIDQAVQIMLARGIYSGVIFLMLLPAIAAAQDAAPSNQSSGAPPISEADNAYGLRVGIEEIGLYTSDEMRGFPLDPGANFRLDGAYYSAIADRAERPEAAALIQAGPNLFAARFPSPTGVVDLITDHDADPRQNIILRGDGFGSAEVLGRLALPVGGGAVWGVGEIARLRNWHGGLTEFDYGAVGGDVTSGPWRLRGGISVGRYDDSITFAVYPVTDTQSLPTYQPDRATPPRWSSGLGWETVSWGSVERTLAEGWTARLAVAHGRYDTDREAFVFLDGVDETGVGTLTATVFGETRAGATSGEFLVERQWSAPHGPARLSFALLGRNQTAALAPSTDFEFGLAAINDEIELRDPGAPAGTAADDLIREGRIAASASYPLTKWLLLSGSVQRVHYTKAYSPQGTTSPRRTDREWGGHVAATISLSDQFSIYGAWVTGLEESGTAPAIAVNANETLPALRATQQEVGLKWEFLPETTLVVSAFDIEKGAPGFDAGGVWALNGTREHRGLELSLVAPIGPVQVVAGALYLDAAITEADGNSAEVVNQSRWRASLNAQWSITDRIAIDAGGYLRGDAPALRNGDAIIPARTDLSLGVTWTLGDKETSPTLRIAGSNLLDNRGWDANDDESLVPIETRAIRASLAFAW